MLNQFSRTQLLYGAEMMEKLAASRVAVLGSAAWAVMRLKLWQGAVSEHLI